MMISVAIIGILGTVAIPAFQNYQNRSKRSEAFANLSSIAKLQKARFGEFAAFADSGGSWPFSGPPTTKRAWTAASEVAFGDIGFRPDGAVVYDYEVHVDLGICPLQDCFTATAYGDADSNGRLAVIQYVEPNTAGAFSPPLIPPPVPFPTDPGTGARRFNEVAVNYSADLY
jgi:type II secretory pathway pseudopilin PulG